MNSDINIYTLVWLPIEEPQHDPMIDGELRHSMHFRRPIHVFTSAKRAMRYAEKTSAYGDRKGQIDWHDAPAIGEDCYFGQDDQRGHYYVTKRKLNPTGDEDY